jgi:hypothetical protein
LDAFKKKLVPVSSAEMALGHAVRAISMAVANTTGKPETIVLFEAVLHKRGLSDCAECTEKAEECHGLLSPYSAPSFIKSRLQGR